MPPMLYLIDGHAQFFRAYHAIRSGMSSPVTKEPTNLTFGFMGMLLKLLREQPPTHLAVAIDVSGDRESFRSEIYPEYKANRESAPEDFHPQVERCLELLKLMDIPVIGLEGVEADDVIATLVSRLTVQHPDLEIRLITRDKDLTQLVSKRVRMFDPYKNEFVYPQDIFKTEGVEPSQVRDILALMGDTVDNVPGVPGIGPKTAAQLIMKYGSIDGLYEHLDEIKGKRRENLEAAREQVEVSRRLVGLLYDCPVSFELQSAAYEPERFDVDGLVQRFRDLGFNRMREDLRKLTPYGTEAPGKSDDAPADSLFAQHAVETSAPRDAGRYEMIVDRSSLEEFVSEIRRAGVCAVDTETDSLNPRRAHLCGLSLAVKPGHAVYIPVRSPEPERHLDQETVLDVLRPVLEDASIGKVGHNLKYDMNVLRRHGVRLAGIACDTMVASYLVDSSRSSHKLDVLALALLNHTCIPLVSLIGSGRQQRTFDTVPLEQATEYAAEDADIALRLRDVLMPEIASLGMGSLFDDLELPLVEVLAELEWNGIRVDADELDAQRGQLQERIDALRQEIINASSHAFNPDSPKQLAAALFNRPDQEPPGLGLKVVRRNKTGPSTDQEVLDKLAADPTIETPVPALIVEYRQLTKLVNTYLVALREAIDPESGRVHASFNQTVAATGRLSSSDPNLQNIPIRTEVGRQIRRAFVADPGHVLITADYSQIELRLLAHLSEDPALIDAFNRGLDIHTAVAAEVYGVAPEDVTGAQRGSAKMVNFGIIYGITPYGLSRRLGEGYTVEQASEIITRYKERFAGITAFMDACEQHAIEQGYVETIWKRRRPIPQITSRNPQERALGRRMAINSVVQGSAADLIKAAMVDLHRLLPARFPTVRMLLQIHDELVFEARESESEAVRELVTDRMEHAMTLRVPLTVQSAVSTTWMDAK